MHTGAVLFFITHVRRTLCPGSWNVTRRRQEAEIFTTLTDTDESEWNSGEQ